MNRIWAILALSTSAELLGGGMVSTGGGIFGTGANPWFFRTGKDAKMVVEYCIDVDPVNFPHDRSTVRGIIDHSIGFWAEQFSAAVVGHGVYVARESYWEVPCKPEVALRFSFGRFSTPDEEEQFRREIGNPTRLVAAAVRTSYDVKTLQGRGFIYLSPSSGPLAMQLDGSRGDVWNDPDGLSRLRGVLMHELGHVFGIQHRGIAGSLMHEAYPERLIRSQDLLLPTSSVFARAVDTWYLLAGNRLGLDDTVAGYFGATADAKSLWYRLHGDNVEFGTTDTQFPAPPVTAIGRGNFSIEPSDRIDALEPVVRILLTDEQTVFSRDLGFSLTVASASRRTRRLLYRPNGVDNSELEMMMKIEPEHVAVSIVTADGRLIPDILARVSDRH